jgi:hypothetical protein
MEVRHGPHTCCPTGTSSLTRPTSLFGSSVARREGHTHFRGSIQRTFPVTFTRPIPDQPGYAHATPSPSADQASRCLHVSNFWTLSGSAFLSMISGTEGQLDGPHYGQRDQTDDMS